MKALRTHLTYANVVATLALVIAIGGASAFAATQLAKNSVGSKQLKKNAVTAAKIKSGAVTGPKIKAGSITGAQVNSATLGTVPSAQTAQTANTLAAPEAWHEIGMPGQPAFLNGWGNNTVGAATAAFYRDAGGVVHLRGTLTGNKDFSDAFVLPPGFRPAAFQAFAVPGTSTSLIAIRPGGEVTPNCNQASCIPGLDGISFRAER